MAGYHLAVSESVESLREEVFDKTYDGRLMRRLLAYVRPYWRMALLAVGLIVGAVGCCSWRSNPGQMERKDSLEVQKSPVLGPSLAMADCVWPLIDTVIASPGDAMPQTGNSRSRCKTMWSLNTAGSLTSA